MKWPNPTDYQDAVQNPRLCFSDPELQAGIVATNLLGLPRVASGNFASVYEVRTGKKRWAVRCFLRQCADQQKHYAHITNHLKGLWLPFLVDFEYQPRGIRLFGQPYPIVKMQWMDGVALHTFVRKKLRRPQDLAKLAAQWRGMVNSLHGSRLAHGDLQHGNVLVTSKGIARLVDYDAMYVSALQGANCAELGHANYQHPQRQANHYDHHLDNFAALVIYVSLRALAVEPELWDKHHTGENLIFSSSDFKAPTQSALFAQLWRSQDAEVRALSVQLAAWCCGPMAQIGNFEAVLTASHSATMPVNAQSQTAMPTLLQQPIATTPQPTSANRWWLDSAAL